MHFKMHCSRTNKTNYEQTANEASKNACTQMHLRNFYCLLMIMGEKNTQIIINDDFFVYQNSQQYPKYHALLWLCIVRNTIHLDAWAHDFLNIECSCIHY